MTEQPPPPALRIDPAVTGRVPWADLMVTAASRFAPAPEGETEDVTERWKEVTNLIEQAQFYGIYDDLRVRDVCVYVHDWEFAVITLTQADGALLATAQFTDDDLRGNLRGNGYVQARALLGCARSRILSALITFDAARVRGLLDAPPHPHRTGGRGRRPPATARRALTAVSKRV